MMGRIYSHGITALHSTSFTTLLLCAEDFARSRARREGAPMVVYADRGKHKTWVRAATDHAPKGATRYRNIDPPEEKS